MKYDLRPDDPGLRHPLDALAPTPVRHILVQYLENARGPVMDAWINALGRVPRPGATSGLEALLPYTMEACLAYLRTGDDTGLNGLFGKVHPPRAETETPAATAAHLNHVLNAFCLATLPPLAETAPDSHHHMASLLLGLTSVAMDGVCRSLEQTVLNEVAAAHESQARFCADVARMATHDCLRLVDEQEIPAPQGPALSIRDAIDGAPVRRACVALAEQVEMTPQRRDDLALAVGEAVSNVLKHVGQGFAHTWHVGDTVYVFVADKGHGIALENIPKVLTPGWSSCTSLGMGFTLMLEMADVLWLSTGRQGTTLCIEKSARARAEPLAECLLHNDLW